MLASPAMAPVVDLLKLRDLLQSQAPLLREQLQAQGISAGEIILPFLLDPLVSSIRQKWRNSCPAFGDEEILLLLLLLTRGKKVEEIDRRTFLAGIGLLGILSAPDSWLNKVKIDFHHRKVLFPQR